MVVVGEALLASRSSSAQLRTVPIALIATGQHEMAESFAPPARAVFIRLNEDTYPISCVVTKRVQGDRGYQGGDVVKPMSTKSSCHGRSTAARR